MPFNRKEYILAHRRQEQASTNIVFKASSKHLNKIANKVVQTVKNNGVAAANAHEYTNQEDVYNLIFETINLEGFKFYQFQNRQFEKQKRKPNVEVQFFSEVWKQRMLRIMSSMDMFQLITKINETTRLAIRGIFTVAIEQRLGAREVARLIRQNHAFSKTRALTIARTEVGFASFLGKEFSADQSQQVLVKEWIHGYAKEPRPHHLALDGRTIPKNEKFDVGGVPMQAPSDPSGGASEVINCSCTVAYLVAD